MSLVCVDQGEEIILTAICAVNYTLQLFSNNDSPIDTDTEADYTLASGGGYADLPLTGGSWTVTPGDPCVALYAAQTFSFSGSGGTVYGYLIVRTSDGKLLFAERFDSGPFVTAVGVNIVVTPRLTLRDEQD